MSKFSYHEGHAAANLIFLPLDNRQSVDIVILRFCDMLLFPRLRGGLTLGYITLNFAK